MASSDRTACQAFRYGPNAYGILFHTETTKQTLRGMIRAFGDELRDPGVDGHEVARKATEYLPGLQAIGRRVFARLAELVEAGEKRAPA